MCADGFGQVEGNVVCKIMQNSEASPSKLQAVEVYPVFYQHLTGVIWPFFLEGLKCNGSEDRIFECHHKGLFNASCPSSTVVVVKCRRNDEDREYKVILKIVP
ncbi:hypothetical protein HOLleu_26406 [Holothuria leucospilota]|uniref:SRCR domain-containing protein n=1 Tax=Holothuria leucospilota TaxID=206669 RepID=A0A9Q1BP69_HOLLE|nr:hypothetical protein HOLleu_26406 [Holothuria leucospilota]